MLKEPKIRPGTSRAEARRKREAFWRRVLKEQAESGVTVTEFCERHLLSRTKYFWWQRQLRLKRSRRGKAQRTDGAPSFVPVEVRQPPPAGGSQHPFELELHGKRVLRIARDFDDESLRRLLAVLEGTKPC